MLKNQECRVLHTRINGQCGGRDTGDTGCGGGRGERCRIGIWMFIGRRMCWGLRVIGSACKSLSISFTRRVVSFVGRQNQYLRILLRVTAGGDTRPIISDFLCLRMLHVMKRLSGFNIYWTCIPIMKKWCRARSIKANQVGARLNRFIQAVEAKHNDFESADE